MKIDVKAKDIKLTPTIEKYIAGKFNGFKKLVKKFEKDGEIYIYFEIGRTTHHHRSGDKVFSAEANMDLLGSKVRAETKNEDIRAAVDEIKDILRREIVKIKSEKVDKKREVKRPGKPKR